MTSAETYEVLAIKYAEHADRTRAENFMRADDHASPMPLDFFVWVLRNSQRTILVDTGFDRAEGVRRGREITYELNEALALIGCEAARIDTVIITHLHHDHAGTLDQVPNAHFHIQEAEMAYATGRCMCEPVMRDIYSVEHVCQMVKRVYSGRVRFHDGDGEVAPGVTVHQTPGHTKGLQVVKVATANGPLVLASDAAHYYENVEKRQPFSVTLDVEATLNSYDRLGALAGGLQNVIPGHDPLVLQHYPSWKPSTKGIVHRLDQGRTL